MSEALSVKKWLAPMLVAILALVCVQAHATLGMLGGSATGVSNLWFGVTLPTAAATFSTTATPPSAGSTCNGSYYTPSTGAALQTDLTAAAAGNCANGDVIEVTSGTTYTTSTCFSLPTRTGTAGPVWVIATDAPDIGGSGLPAAGTRVGPTNVADMAALRSSGTSNPNVICRGSAANNYRLVGLDIELTNTNGTSSYVVQFNNSDTSSSTLAQHITFDRDFIDGSPAYGVTHAIGFEGDYIAIIESYFGTHVFSIGNADCQDILIYNSLGPYQIHDNYMQAAGETSLVGGSNTSLPSPSEPSDIVINNNHYYKDFLTATGSVTNGSSTLTISSVSAGYVQLTTQVSDANNCIPSGTTLTAQLTGTDQGAGTYTMSANATCSSTSPPVAITGVPSGKNMIEFKEGIRVLVDSNFFENAGAAGQPRSGFTLTASNYSPNTWMLLTDFTITRNAFMNMEFGGVNTLLQANASNDNVNTGPAARILFQNDLFCQTTNDGSDSTGMMSITSDLSGGTGPGGGQGSNVLFDHDTFINTNASNANSILNMGNSSTAMTLSNVIWSNVIFDKSQYGILNNGSVSTYSGAITTQCSSCNMINSVITGSSDSTIPTGVGNAKPASETNVGYTSYGSCTSPTGYALTSGSTYHAAGVTGSNLPYTSAGTADGTDIGANISTIPTS